MERAFLSGLAKAKVHDRVRFLRKMSFSERTDTMRRLLRYHREAVTLCDT